MFFFPTSKPYRESGLQILVAPAVNESNLAPDHRVNKLSALQFRAEGLGPSREGDCKEKKKHRSAQLLPVRESVH